MLLAEGLYRFIGNRCFSETRLLTTLQFGMSSSSSLVNLRNLGYNIIKSLEDKAVSEIVFPELEPCIECNNGILTPPFKTLTTLSCGHTLGFASKNAFYIPNRVHVHFSIVGKMSISWT